MKVYVVTYCGLDSEQRIEKVFASESKAKAFIEKKGASSEIHTRFYEEFKLDA